MSWLTSLGRPWAVVGATLGAALALTVGLTGTASSVSAASTPAPFAAKSPLTTGASAVPGAVLDRVLTDPRIGESSGLAVSRRHEGVLWTHNDSGDAARLYAIGPDGPTLATVTLAGVRPRDWEALASSVDSDGTPVLWVADIGDNLGARINGVIVHRIEEPMDLADVEVEPMSYRLRYPGAPVDAESVLVDPSDGRLLVVTKTPVGGVVYAAPLPLSAAEPNLLEPLGPAPNFLTDGAFAPDGRMLVRGYGGMWAGDPESGWSGPVKLPPAEQGESLAVSVDGTSMYVGSEGVGSEVWRVPLPGAVAPAAATGPAAAAPDWGQDRPYAAADGAQWAIPVLVGGLAFLLALALVVTRRIRR